MYKYTHSSPHMHDKLRFPYESSINYLVNVPSEYSVKHSQSIEISYKKILGNVKHSYTKL
jgi:hypothetical protein